MIINLKNLKKNIVKASTSSAKKPYKSMLIVLKAIKKNDQPINSNNFTVNSSVNALKIKFDSLDQIELLHLLYFLTSVIERNVEHAGATI